MLKWLAMALLGWPWCKHRWAIIEEVELRLNGKTQGFRKVLQCQHCGDVTSRMI